jgi:hypothetical protein
MLALLTIQPNRNDNVIETLYPFLHKCSSGLFENKVSYICDVLRAAMSVVDSKKFSCQFLCNALRYSLAILLCYVKKSPPDIPAALSAVKSDCNKI